jgi:diguanylate cyclase (GGDEF)-like protein/PAS domain S-box-containing protein
MYNSFNYAMTLSRIQHPHQRFIPTVASFPRNGIVLVSETGQVLFANQSAESLLGIPIQRLLEEPFPYPLQPNQHQIIQTARPSGQVVQIDLTVQTAYGSNGSVYLVTLHDPETRLSSSQRQTLLTQAFETTPEAIFITDEQGRILLANRAFAEITGYSVEEVIGKEALAFHCDQRDAEFYRQMWHSLTLTGAWQGEIWNRRKDGEVYPEWLTISTVKDEKGRISNYIAIFADISTRKQAEERLRFLATHDPLTGLPNRELFHDRLEQALARSRRARTGQTEKWRVAVLLMDLDNFKEINDTLGHGWGDRTLIAVAERLQASVRKSDSISRLGGDEFTILLEGIANKESCAIVAQKILRAISQPLELDGKSFQLSASIGISLYPEHGEDSETLIKHADVAMYRAKQHKDCFRFFQNAH